MPANEAMRLWTCAAGTVRLSRWLVVGVPGAALLLGVMTMFQDRLLYFPQRATVDAMATPTLSPWPSAQNFHGLIAEPVGAARATAIVLHGNAGHAGQREHYVAAVASLGVRVILAEYPRYGPRDGALGETSLVADAADSIEQAHKRYGAPLLVIGESLGAGVAAAAVARRPELVAGLVLITPWDRLENVASHHYPWLPVRWLLRDRYDSASHLSRLRVPIAVAVAENDRIVPARFGVMLYEALGEPKRLLTIAGAGHNDWPDRVDRQWWQQTLAFLLDGATTTR
jgi:alpha-beta hydrolase superfamily lysophospholipase